ncbi:MAG: hypothetical protein ACLPJH_16970 [Myxococcaceae bacterium]
MVAVFIGKVSEAQKLCDSLQLKHRGWWGTCRMGGPDGHVLIYRGAAPTKEIDVVPGFRILAAGAVVPMPPTRGYEWSAPGPIWQRDIVTDPVVYVDGDGNHHPRGVPSVQSVLSPVPEVLLAALQKAA